MKALIAAVALACFATSAAAQSTCAVTAQEKKLAGAAKSSYMKKCANDTCEAAANEKKLAGAARNSFLKKCVADTVGE